MRTHESRSERALSPHVLESGFLRGSRSKTPLFSHFKTRFKCLIWNSFAFTRAKIRLSNQERAESRSETSFGTWFVLMWTGPQCKPTLRLNVRTCLLHTMMYSLYTFCKLHWTNCAYRSEILMPNLREYKWFVVIKKTIMYNVYYTYNADSFFLFYRQTAWLASSWFIVGC